MSTERYPLPAEVVAPVTLRRCGPLVVRGQAGQVPYEPLQLLGQGLRLPRQVLGLPLYPSETQPSAKGSYNSKENPHAWT